MPRKRNKREYERMLRRAAVRKAIRHRRYLEYEEMRSEVVARYPRTYRIARAYRAKPILTTSEMITRMRLYDPSLTGEEARRWLRAFTWAIGTAMFDGYRIRLARLVILDMTVNMWRSARRIGVRASTAVRVIMPKATKRLIWTYFKRRGPVQDVRWAHVLPERYVHPSLERRQAGRSALPGDDAAPGAGSASAAEGRGARNHPRR